MKKFNEISEETRAMEWLDKKRKDYNLNSEDLHYLNVLYYLITNLLEDKTGESDE